MTTETSRWQPMSPTEVAALLAGAEFPWWIAGGHAIDHAVGRSVRPHADIDVLLLRIDHLLARKVLAGWDCWAADPPGILRPWKTDELLAPGISDIWCREHAGGPWRLQLLLDSGDRADWRSRRNLSVTLPIVALGKADRNGIPFLVPEVPLFYKAKAPRPKDEADLAAALPWLDKAQLTWLRRAIGITYGDENIWLARIDAALVR